MGDDADAVNVISQAIVAFSEFFEDNKIPLEFAQILKSFVRVKKAIGDMITRLTAEKQDDENPKADCTITISDADFVAMADGKLDGMQAFMGGKLKIKGNMMLAQKLAGILEAVKK